MIHKLCKGRVFRDAVKDGERFRLRFMDGYELQIAWGDKGPEAVAEAQGIITTDMDMHPQFRHVCGKVVKRIMTDGQQLMIYFTDGHCLRSSFGRSGPEVKGVDVSIPIESVIASVQAGSAF